VESEEEMEKVGRELIASASEDEEEEKENEEIGSGSEEEGAGNDRDTISKYRSMLADILGTGDGKERDDGDMEVTWAEPEQEEEEDNEKVEFEEEIGPWQKYLQKKKEKKKNRKNAKKASEDNLESDDEIPDGVDMNDPFFAEEFGKEFKKEKTKDKKKKKRKHTDDVEDLEVPENKALDLLVDSDDEKNHFNFKDIVENETKPTKTKKKWNKKKKEIIKPVEDNFSVDVSDERFGALFTRPEFNIDPTESSFKKTKNMEKIIGEKLKRIQDPTVPENALEAGIQVKKPKLEADISQSLKTVKNKWKQNAKKNRSKKF